MSIKDLAFALGFVSAYGGVVVLALSILGFICNFHLKSLGITKPKSAKN